MSTLEEAEDPVAAAAAALAEAASASARPYSPAALAALAAAPASLLAEAGGVMSWLRRLYTGKDEKIPGELREEIRGGVASEEDRRLLLAQCDELIRKAEEALTDGTGIDLLKSLAGAIPLSLIPGAGPLLAAAHSGAMAVGRTGARADGAVRDYLRKLREVRAEIKKAPAKGA